MVAIVAALIGAAATVTVALINKPSASVLEIKAPGVSEVSRTLVAPVSPSLPAPLGPDGAGLPNSSQDLLAAKKYYAAGDYSRALLLFRNAALTGDGEAANYIAVMYAKGMGGLPKDDVQAVEWYRKAADAGFGLAISNLGVMYAEGLGGLPKDEVQAVQWYRKAADAGVGQAMALLGSMYQYGAGGLPKDNAQAVQWYRKAADTGYGIAMTCLGAMYASGDGGLTLVHKCVPNQAFAGNERGSGTDESPGRQLGGLALGVRRDRAIDGVWKSRRRGPDRKSVV